MVDMVCSCMTWLLGMHDLAKTQGKPTTIHIQNAIKHPEYGKHGRHGMFLYDVAVIKLMKPIAKSALIKTIRLANEGEYDMETCMITGWGKTAGHWRVGPSSTLQQADTREISREECAKYFTSKKIVDAHQCLRSGYTGACQMDSGGPAMCKSKSTGEWLLTGVTSGGDS